MREPPISSKATYLRGSVSQHLGSCRYVPSHRPVRRAIEAGRAKLIEFYEGSSAGRTRCELSSAVLVLVLVPVPVRQARAFARPRAFARAFACARTRARARASTSHDYDSANDGALRWADG